MAYHIYRYRWTGLNMRYQINERIDPTLPAALVGTGPYVYVDVSADDSTKTDLDTIMAFYAWEFVSTDPGTPLP